MRWFVEWRKSNEIFAWATLSVTSSCHDSWPQSTTVSSSVSWLGLAARTRTLLEPSSTWLATRWPRAPFCVSTVNGKALKQIEVSRSTMIRSFFRKWKTSIEQRKLKKQKQKQKRKKPWHPPQVPRHQFLIVGLEQCPALNHWWQLLSSIRLVQTEMFNNTWLCYRVKPVFSGSSLVSGLIGSFLARRAFNCYDHTGTFKCTCTLIYARHVSIHKTSKKTVS